ncbi:unnamed protein product [Tenebrio molitor]|nr:unnamed protein product [Tenebrio molitor]
MSVPRYTFSKEVEPELVNFLKVAEKQKSNKKCKLRSHEVWSKLLALDPNLIQKLKECENVNTIPTIDLCSQEETEVPARPENENVEVISQASDKFAISDVAFGIKENLETQNDLSKIAKDNLSKYVSTELEELFDMLNQTLSSEEIFYLGNSLQSIVSNVLINIFCHHLLIPRIKKEYCDKILMLLDQFSSSYATILNEEFVSIMTKLKEEETKMCLQYLKKLNPNFQSALVRDFILAVKTLNDNHLIIIQSLLNNQVEYEALNKLVEMLSNIAEDHSRDKSFGKLLMNTVEVLGPNLIRLEQPLKHIIAGHKSIWKSKLEKTFDTCFEDSMMFSQSFRD